MVSTRGIKYKFGEGEKVLCYEPDPTKAKVLYDSKVLEVVENKDKRGRKCVEYLIHFQGWNSSWDRCVREDFVLKDTEENRQLQRDLAEKSQLQLGAYLYRKDRKSKRNRKLSERIHDSLNSGGKIRRGGSSEDGSSCSTTGQRDIDTDDTQHDDGDSETCSSIDNIDSTDDDRVVIDLGDILRNHLEHDFERVKLQNKCHNLPAEPNVVKILENYVKHYAVQQLTFNPNEPSRGRNTSPNKKTRDFDKVCRNLNICKEVCDGLRIYFDFILKDHLLYLPETEQFHELQTEIIKNNTPEMIIKNEEISIDEEDLKQADSEPQSPSDIPLFAHLSVEPTLILTPGTNTIINTNAPVTRSASSNQVHSPIPTASAGSNNVGITSLNTANSSSLNEPRRLRSHKTSCETQEHQDNAPTLMEVVVSSSVSVKEETAPSSVATTSSRCSTPRNVPTSAQLGPNNVSENSQNNFNLPPKWNKVLQQVMSWKLMPDDIVKENPTAPSLTYGALHLTRLLVKLPEFLSAANLSDEKLSIVMKHLDMFIDYLEEHKEWYEETN